MNNSIRFLSQVCLYAVFAVIVGYLSFWPRYEYASGEYAIVKLSLSHAADRVNPCVQLTPEEIAALAPNMRQSERCERERLPLTLELDVDGDIIMSLQAQPSGLWNDGPSSIYQRFKLRPGSHRITARLRDTARLEGWDYTKSQDVEAVAGRYLTITFKAATEGFIIR